MLLNTTCFRSDGGMDHLGDPKDEPTSPDMNGHQTSLEADTPPPQPQPHQHNNSMFNDFATKETPLTASAMMTSQHMTSLPGGANVPQQQQHAPDVGVHHHHHAMTSHMNAHNDAHHAAHAAHAHAYSAALSNYQAL